MALLQIYTALLQIDTATAPANTYNTVNSRNPWPIFLDLVLKEFRYLKAVMNKMGLGTLSKILAFLPGEGNVCIGTNFLMKPLQQLILRHRRAKIDISRTSRKRAID